MRSSFCVAAVFGLAFASLLPAQAQVTANATATITSPPSDQNAYPVDTSQVGNVTITTQNFVSLSGGTPYGTDSVWMQFTIQATNLIDQTLIH